MINKITDSNFESIVYISHIYQNKQENLDIVANKIRELQKEYPTYLFISPMHMFQMLYDVVDYDKGMEFCLFMLEKCDEMWVVCSKDKAEESVGVQREIEYCKEFGIPYYYCEEVGNSD